jgi:putative hydrolase of the HAD superfamily
VIRPRAVLLDALGTLVRLEPPAPRLRVALRERLGVDVAAEDAERAVRAEIAYYRAHIDEGRSAAALADLRRRCAAVMGEALGEPVAHAGLDALTAALLDSLRFAAYPDVEPALRALRAGGARLVVVSNWDVSLHEVLAGSPLGALVDAAVTSAELGAAKPDPAIFARALELAGAAPEEAWHAGDSMEADVAGARAAGIEPILVARDGEPAPPGVRAVADLGEIAAAYSCAHLR